VTAAGADNSSGRADRAVAGDGSAYLDPAVLAQLTPFELRAKMLAEGVMSGPHRSPYRGSAVEFAESRPYVHGDDVRHVDWKVFARTEKLYVKQHHTETNLDVMLLVDASSSMRFGSPLEAPGAIHGSSTASPGPWMKYDHATAVAAAMVYVCLHRRDRAGLAVFTDRLISTIDCSNHPDQWRKIVHVLGGTPPAAATDMRRATDELLALITRRSLIVIVSDFFEDAEHISKALAHLRHQNHDVILIQTLDRREMTFGFERTAVLEGLENEGRWRVDPRALREEYLAALRAHVEAIERAAQALGFDYLRADTHEAIGPPLAFMLARRSAALKGSSVG
jgi:uncharacterized protein (DUF58 family)